SAATSAAITPRALTVQASGVDRVYDGGVAAGATLSDNRVGGDALTLASGAASFADKNVGAAKAVSVSGIVVGGADAANYTFNSTAGASASITPAALTITANDAGKSVGQQNPAFSANYSALQGSDTVASALTGALVLNTPATNASVAGDYGITPSGQQGANYHITFVDGVLKVNTVAALTNVVNSAIAMTAVTPSLGNMVGPNQLSLTTPGSTGGSQGTLTLALNAPAPASSFSTSFPATATATATPAPSSDGGANSGASNTASNGGSNSSSNSSSNSGSDSGSGVTTTASVSSSSGTTASGGTTRGGAAPAVRSTASVVTNMLPGLNLTVIDLGVKLPNNVKNTGE
ncbi:MAG TPA: hypothetical protein DCW29_12940, partial [Janthinobacterium sp.]|nr:hypothetical protein [Janthinobacterium sp.]